MPKKVFLLTLALVQCLLPGGLRAADGAEEVLFGDIPIVYVASAKNEGLNDAPAHVYVITSKQIRERGYRTLMDLIPDLPSSFVIPFASNASGYPTPPFGTSGHRGVLGGLKIMFNGMEVDPRYGYAGVWEERIPVEGIDHVEFILGPYASLYGRNTYSGVLNVVLKKGSQVDGVEFRGLYGNSTEYGTVQQGQGTVLFGKKWGKTDVYLSLFANQSHNGLDLAKDYPGIYGLDARRNGTFNGSPTVFGAGVPTDFVLPWTHRDLYLAVSHDAGLSLNLNFNDDGGPNITSRFNPNNYYATNESRRYAPVWNGQLKYEHAWDRLSLETSVAYQNWVYRFKNTDLSNGRIRWFAAESYSARGNVGLRYRFADINEAYLSVSREGVREYSTRNNNNKAVPPTTGWPDLTRFPRYDDRYLNISLQDEHRFTENLKAVAGVMWENSDTYYDVKRRINLLLPRLSVLWNATENGTLKVLYGEGYTTPSRTYINDLTGLPSGIPGRTVIKGTTFADIKGGRITSYDVQWLQNHGTKARSSLSAYYTLQRHFVGIVPDLTLPLPYFAQYRSQNGRRESYGGEAEVEMELTEGLKGLVQYAYVDGWSTVLDPTTMSGVDKQRGVLFTPRHSVKVGANQLLWRRKLNFYVHDTFTGKSAQWQGVGLKSWLGSYNTVDVHLGTTDDFSRSVSFGVGVWNVFNNEGFITRPLSLTANRDFFMIDSPIRKRFYTLEAGYKF